MSASVQMGCDANDARAGTMSGFEIVQRSDAGEQQGRDLGLVHGRRGSFDPLEIGVRAEAIHAR